MASMQSQILERLERLEVTSAMWEQEQGNWNTVPGSAEFDLEGALGGLVENEQEQRRTVQHNAVSGSVATFGIASDGSGPSSMCGEQRDDEAWGPVRSNSLPRTGETMSQPIEPGQLQQLQQDRLA